MVFPVDLKSDWNALSNISSIASSLSQTLADLNIPIIRHPLPNNIDTLIPNLVLTFPRNVLAPLSTLHIPETSRVAILQSMDRFIVELQQQYTSKYRHTCLETFRVTNSIDDVDAVHRTYQALSQKQFVPMIQSQVAFIVAEVAKHQSDTGEHKRLFNNDFIPVLEKYFVLNGYPSIVHRSTLAEKSRMAPRQIEVWFQNHRRRAKQEGKIVPRLDSDLPLRQALGTIRQDAPTYQNRLPTPSDEDIENRKSSVKDENPNISVRRILLQKPVAKPATLLDDSYEHRPPHAYPATSNACYAEPFPKDEGVFKFPSPTWKRKPATVPIVSMAVDMDEFARIFHLKLNFSENPCRRGTTPSKRELPSFQPWFTATTTLAPPAPHPALVRTPPRPTLPISTPSSAQFTFKPTFGSSSLPASTAPLPAPPGEAPARKMRPLPRRTPPRSRSNPFGSRTSSFSSDTSSGSRMSSSSSDYSSPEPPTPPALPNLDLPAVHDDGQQQNLFETSQSYELDTNNPFSDFLPSQTFDISNTNSDSNKLPDFSIFDMNTFWT